MATFAVLVGGGPAPGLNGVISAVTLEAIRRGHKVLGIRSGYELLMKGDLGCAKELMPVDVEIIHRLGGSIIGTSRANPQKSVENLDNVVSTLTQLKVDYLVTIGGDDTSSSAGAISRAANGKVKVAHVPKTIDNDLPLPDGIPTFGFETARQAGANILESLMADARTASRWYLAVAMGRKAGHLALGMGVSAASSLTLIPEQFPDDKYQVSALVDKLVGSILKNRINGKNYGVAVLAEGILEKVDPESLPELNNAERDEHGHIRYAELDFGGILKRAVTARLAELGAKPVTIVEKNVGYELRSIDPCPYDQEYTRLLGFGAVDLLLKDQSEIMVSVQKGKIIPINFSDMIDPVTKKTSVRYVNTGGALFKASQRFMTLLTVEDLESSSVLESLARCTTLSSAEFKMIFPYVQL
jgi:6-phosphofructokinase